MDEMVCLLKSKVDGIEFSFSGLKTAVLRARDELVNEKGGLTNQDRADICAGFQAAVSDVFSEKARRAAQACSGNDFGVTAFAVAGGVAANKAIRAGLETVSIESGLNFIAPPLALCTDNAAMIAWAGIELHLSGRDAGNPIVARPRWPLDNRQPALLGSGKKGAKA